MFGSRMISPNISHYLGRSLVLGALFLVGCADKTPSGDNQLKQAAGYYVDGQHHAVGQNNRQRFLILHYTALDDNKSLKTLTEEQVSAHYLVPSSPRLFNGQPVVYQLVDEQQRAWHAGVSQWQGRANLNDSSIGIEIVNAGYTENLAGERHWYPYPQGQVQAIAALAKDIIKRYDITPDNVLAHSDISPTRKSDPGPLFPWQALAAQGIGAWPEAQRVACYLGNRNPNQPTDVHTLQALLKTYGYDAIPQNGQLDEPTRKTITAFQYHFRPHAVTGTADAETEAIAEALNAQYRSSAGSQPLCAF